MKILKELLKQLGIYFKSKKPIYYIVLFFVLIMYSFVIFKKPPEILETQIFVAFSYLAIFAANHTLYKMEVEWKYT